jgi:hypothetical protein
VKISRTPSLIVAALAGVLWLTNAHAADDDWKYSVTPYLWLPSFNGNFKYSLPPGSGGSPEVETTYYLNKLNAALMLAGEAHKGKMSFFTDLIYLDISGSDSHVKAVDFGGSQVGTSIDAGTQTSIRGTVWTLGGGYTVVQSANASLDVIGGLRYLGVDVSTDWHLTTTITDPIGGGTFPLAGTVSDRVDLWDAIIGVRGRTNLGEAGKWSLPYYLDVGLGSSIHTWQGMMGVAYTYGWGDALLAYRHLSYGQGSDQFIQNLSLSGPLLGATFRF